MKKKGNMVLLGCGIVFLLISLLGCKADPQMYSVTFDSNDGSDVARQEIQENGKATRPADPTKTGYVFDNWHIDSPEGNVWDFGTAVTGDMTLYANWESYNYKVTFDSQGATTEATPTSKTVTSPATTVGVLPAAPEKTDYSFDGWYTAVSGGGTKFTADTTVTGDITVYAKWFGPVTLKGFGPSGGYVFYDKGEYTDGWRYLEAAPEGWSGTSTDPTYVFGYNRTTSDGTNVAVGTNTGIGTGKANTVALVAAMGEKAYNSGDAGLFKAMYAAKACADYRGGGHDDWFLPSKDELNQMYINLKKNSLGGFSADDYWSSSEGGAIFAWHQNFNYGYQNDFDRYPNDRVRPVRAF